MHAYPITPACPDAPTSSAQPAYSSPRFRPPGTPHRVSRRPTTRPVSAITPISSTPSNLTHLVEIKNQIQLTHIPKEAIQHLDEKMYRFQIRQLVVVRVDAHAEEEACVAPVDDLQRAEFDEVGLVLLVSGGDEAVDLLV